MILSICKRWFGFFLLLMVITSSNFASEAKSNIESNKHNGRQSRFEAQEEKQQIGEQYPSMIRLSRPNYLMPLYHTSSPYQAVYKGNTPNNQAIQKDELKAQLSFMVPLLHTHIFHRPLALNTAYTQLMYWQVYAKSQYFRETNYEPELFIESPVNRKALWQLGVNHQSNGRGGILERSWNRVYAQYAHYGSNWLFRARVWSLIAQSESSDLHNPRIAYYLGYENIVFSYNWHGLNGAVQLQNLESGLKRGFVLASLSYRVLPALSLYGQFFSGYGQSLIEYNHKTNGLGLGIALNDWVN